ncbi:MAG: hypothetical protein JWQ22_2186 [Devosia sp.]|nr:hypothetical protein [Devosia sp.]
MPPTNKFPLRLFALLTTVPAALVGGGLWYLSSLTPGCTTAISDRLTAPDAKFDLVVFSRACGETGPNTQAAVIPVGDDLPEDATSFASIGVAADLDPRWDGFGNIELTLPQGAKVYRQDGNVAGIAVIYR